MHRVLSGCGLKKKERKRKAPGVYRQKFSLVRIRGSSTVFAHPVS